MITVSGEVLIDAGSGKVWEVLADLGGIERWSPTVGRSYVTTQNARGVGARRHLELVGARADAFQPGGMAAAPPGSLDGTASTSHSQSSDSTSTRPGAP